MGTDDFIFGDLFELVILNEFLRKDLLIASEKFVRDFENTSHFDYSQKIAYSSLLDFFKDDVDTLYKLRQFLLNLELFIVKLYAAGENEKTILKKTQLKLLRQAFSHRKSSDLLDGDERAVFVIGLAFDFQSFDVSVSADKGIRFQHIPYKYSTYVDVLLSSAIKGFGNKKSNVRQLRELNKGLISELFHKLRTE